MSRYVNIDVLELDRFLFLYRCNLFVTFVICAFSNVSLMCFDMFTIFVLFVMFVIFVMFVTVDSLCLI